MNRHQQAMSPGSPTPTDPMMNNNNNSTSNEEELFDTMDDDDYMNNNNNTGGGGNMMMNNNNHGHNNQNNNSSNGRNNYYGTSNNRSYHGGGGGGGSNHYSNHSHNNHNNNSSNMMNYSTATNINNNNNNNNNMFDDSVDLGEQLGSQIEYNNQLLRTIQDMERKSQEQNRLMSKKDQDLRLLRTEISNLRSQLESVHDETSAISQQMDSQKLMYEEMMNREREDMNRKLTERDDEMENLQSKMDQQLYQMQENLLEKDAMIRQLEEAIKMQQENMKLEQNRRMEHQSVQMDEMKRNFYSYLGTVQKQLREFALVSQELRDKYSHTNSKLNTIQMMKNTLLEFETSNSESLMRDLKASYQERQALIENRQQGSDKIQDLEVQLEEERAKSIMLEEKTSRLEQQYNDLQRRSEKDLEEAMRKANTQMRIVNDSIGKLKLQLEEKEKLLSMIQKERSIVVEEKQELEKEYMELLSRSSNSSFIKPSADSAMRKSAALSGSSMMTSSYLAGTGTDRLNHSISSQLGQQPSRKEGSSFMMRSSMYGNSHHNSNNHSFMPDANASVSGGTSGMFSSHRPSSMLGSTSSIPPVNTRYSSYNMNTSLLDSSIMSTGSVAQETTRHNEEMEEIYNKTNNLQEKLREVSIFQQTLNKDFNK